MRDVEDKNIGLNVCGSHGHEYTVLDNREREFYALCVKCGKCVEVETDETVNA